MNPTILSIQQLLAATKFYAGALDGMDGPLTDRAVQDLREYGADVVVEPFQALVRTAVDGDFGDETESAWRAVKIRNLPIGATLAPEHCVLASAAVNWTVRVDGDDLVVKNGVATAFGGDEDAGDDGQTACGYPTKGHPDLLACSLPENIHSIRSLRGSPIPRLPYGLHADGSPNPDGAFVVVTFDNGLVTAPLPVVDIGPSLYTDHILDLAVAAARLRKPAATANNFACAVSYRILGMAKYVPLVMLA